MGRDLRTAHKGNARATSSAPGPTGISLPLRRAAELWLATGVVPVAHIVAALGGAGELTGAFEAMPHTATTAAAAARRTFLHW
ncbi:MAG: hypothetical protein H7066_18550 [Cytophagaceae bacterium]|nr:hypothetical protein [Gemmatimonadaceae bacterium]